MAINLLKRENSLKVGIQAKRLKAAWDHDQNPCGAIALSKRVPIK